MIKVTKVKKKLNVDYTPEEGPQKGKKQEACYENVPVVFINGLDEGMLTEFVKKGDKLKLGNICKNFNQKVLHHDASSAVVSLAEEVLKGNKKESELRAFEYTFNYDRVPTVILSPEEKAVNALAALTPEQLEAVLKLAKATKK